jgi:hypothetical protein
VDAHKTTLIYKKLQTHRIQIFISDCVAVRTCGSKYNHRYYIKDPAQVLPKYVVRFTFIPGSAGALKGAAISANQRYTADDAFEEYDFFDPVLHKPVSLKEKMATASSTRQLITVEEAYQTALAEYGQPDALFEAKKGKIDKQLEAVDERVRLINLNYAEIHEAISEAAGSFCSFVFVLLFYSFFYLLPFVFLSNSKREQTPTPRPLFE